MMARRRRTKNTKGMGMLIVLLIGFIAIIVESVTEFVVENKELFIALAFFIIVVVISFFVKKSIVNGQRKALLNEILRELHLENIDTKLKIYDDQVIVKSRQALDNYSDLKYFKENGPFENARQQAEIRKHIKGCLYSFLQKNDFEKKSQYRYVKEQLLNYMQMADGYKVLITYITSAANKRGERILHISASRIDELVAHPEYLITKGEYNKLLKQQAKEEVEAKRHLLYDSVNAIIDFTNEAKEKMVVKSQKKILTR